MNDAGNFTGLEIGFVRGADVSHSRRGNLVWLV